MQHDDAGPATEPRRTGDNDSAYRPGYEIAAEQILEYIASEQLGPGDRIGTERDLSDLLHVSRTVTREAVKILSALGRLTVRKGSGVHVGGSASPLGRESWNLFLPADPDQVQMLFELRRTLELETSRLAATRAAPRQVRELRAAAARCDEAAQRDDFESFRHEDESFHRAIATASNNMFFESTVGVVSDLKRQVLTIGLQGGQSGSLLAAAKEHLAISEAIAAGDPSEAAAAMAEHIDVAVVQFRNEIRRRMLDADLSSPEPPAKR
ncbi:MAG: FadR/GntR family transcriptional regulator [Nocardioidaceae bacterium]